MAHVALPKSKNCHRALSFSACIDSAAKGSDLVRLLRIFGPLSMCRTERVLYSDFSRARLHGPAVEDAKRPRQYHVGQGKSRMNVCWHVIYWL